MKTSEWNTGYFSSNSVNRINQKAILNERCHEKIDFNDAAFFSICAEFILSNRSEEHPNFTKYK